MSAATFAIGVRGRYRPAVYASEKKCKRKYILYGNPNKKYTFTPYTGYRWRVPEQWLTVSIGIQQKFLSVSACANIDDIINRVRTLCYAKLVYYTPSNEWSPPPKLLDPILRYSSTMRSEWKMILHMLLSLQRLTKALSILAYRFKVHKAKKRIINTLDVITMEIPVTPIYVIDMKQRCTYVYEASTLHKAMTRRLLTSDYMFVNPLEPKNLLSNEEFTLGQNIAVFTALKATGNISWALDRFRLARFNIHTFKLRNRQALKLEAISFHFHHQPECSRETVLDFFDAKSERENMDYLYVVWFKDNYAKEEHRDYIKKWITLTRQFYESTELNEPIKIEHIIRKSKGLLDELKQLID